MTVDALAGYQYGLEITQKHGTVVVIGIYVLLSLLFPNSRNLSYSSKAT